MNSSSSVAIDSTGFKTTIRRDWLSNKWAMKRKRGIKLHVSADTESHGISHFTDGRAQP